MADREADMTAPALLACPEPPGDWHTWLVEGDRSTGKTTRGARWLLAQALAGPEKSLWAVCAPTWDMARNSLEALIAQTDPGDVESYVKDRLDLTLRNKARIRGFCSESAVIRGYNLAGAWFDDAHLIRHYSFYRDGLQPALRIGKRPRLLLTATPPCTGLTGEIEDAAADGDQGIALTVLAGR
jgi:phage terminase large subunit-like protein